MVLVLAMELVVVGGGQMPSAIAAPPRPTVSKATKTTNPRVAFNPPNRRAPRETRGGSSRGNLACSTTAMAATEPLVSLVPPSQYGLTLAEHPTLFAYLPTTSAQAMYVSLKDGDGHVQYQATLPIPGRGIVPIHLPPDAPALVLGQPYEWNIALLCGGKLRPDSPFVSGWIERVPVPQELAAVVTDQIPTTETAVLYAKAGIWYDTLALLIDLKQQQPYDAAMEELWQEFLGSVGLEAVAAQPFALRLSSR